jgi:hypothetical protein
MPPNPTGTTSSSLATTPPDGLLKLLTGQDLAE